MDKNKTTSQETFLLVHGAWFAGWCWEKVEIILHSLGHRTIALDLPGHGFNEAPLEEQTLQSYVDYVVSVLDNLSEPIILVGHSMGGVIVSMVAEERPEKIKKLIYYSAFMLQPGQSVNGYDGTGIKPLDLYSRSADGKTIPWSKEQFDKRFAVDCSRRDKEYMMSRLCSEAIHPLVTPVYPTKERWGSVRRFYIASDHDGAANPEAVDIMVTNAPCEKVYTMKADHLGMYSNPEELSYILHEISML